MKKQIIRLFTYSLISYLFITPAFAGYMLPYPSYMPGNKMYKVTRITDSLKKYWYFGNIAQTKYHLLLADKYLVEAKTLMEYSQYLLAIDALARSDKEFGQIPLYLKNVSLEKKDISQLKNSVIEAAKKHNEIMDSLRIIVPEQFTWTPEKETPTELNLAGMLDASKTLRTKAVTDISSY